MRQKPLRKVASRLANREIFAFNLTGRLNAVFARTSQFIIGEGKILTGHAIRRFVKRHFFKLMVQVFQNLINA
jgi:hypothetical protein